MSRISRGTRAGTGHLAAPPDRLLELFVARGAQVAIHLLNGAKIFAEVVTSDSASVTVLPWGARTTTRIRFDDVAHATVAEVSRHAEFREIANRQRAEFEAPDPREEEEPETEKKVIATTVVLVDGTEFVVDECPPLADGRRVFSVWGAARTLALRDDEIRRIDRVEVSRDAARQIAASQHVRLGPGNPMSRRNR